MSAFNLLSKVHAIDEEPDTTVDPKYSDVTNSLFGERKAVPTPAISTEPGDHGYDSPYQQPGHSSAFDADTLRQGREFMSQNGFLPTQFQQSFRIDINDEYLRSLAKLSVSEILLKLKLSTEPLKLIASWGFKFLGNEEKALEMKGISVEHHIDDFIGLLEEVQFQEIKAYQRANNLKIPPVTELVSSYKLAFYQKLAGDGFENIIALGEAAYNKFKK